MTGRISIDRTVPRAVLRKIKRPLFDTVKFERGDVINSPIPMFVSPIGSQLPNGTIKTESWTNMRQSSRLGIPQEFDMYGVRTDFLRLDADPESMTDYMYFIDKCVIAFLFANRIFSDLLFSHFPGAISDMKPGEVDQLEDIKRQRVIVQFGPPFKESSDADAPKGSRLLFTADHKPVAISSSEDFHWELKFDQTPDLRYGDYKGVVSARTSFKFRLSMLGMLYAAI